MVTYFLSNIRVTYSGLIAFSVSILGVLTGTIFVIMVTRKLTPDDLGLWTLIGSIVGYVLIAEAIVEYWTTRQIARGEKIGKTAFTVNGLLSLGGIFVYFIIALYVSSNLGTDFNILLLAAALVPLAFLNNVLNAICIGFRPQVISYGLMSFESSKIILGIFFVVIMQLGIVGALITTIGASFVNLIILLYFSREQLVDKVKSSVIKFWFRLSWLTLYGNVHGLIYKLDVLIFSLLTSSLVGLAYWGVTAAATNLVAYSSQVSQGLYPKLVATGKSEIAEESLKKTMYFAIPLLGLTVLMAKPALHVLNPIYIDGVFIVMIMAFRNVINILMGFFFSILEAKETIDIDKTASFRQYLKSNLFMRPTLMLIFSGVYVGSLTIFLIFWATPDMTDVQTVIIWSFILLGANIIFMIVGLILVIRYHQFVFPYIPVLKYTLAAIIGSFAIFLITENIIYTDSVYDFLPQIIPIVLVGGGIYVGITYIIDNSTRILVKAIIEELLNSIKRFF